MDNRLTKRRLSDFLAYEWILTLVVAAVAIVVMELIYTVSAVRLSVGQSFKFYYDQGLYSFEVSDFYNLLDVAPGENGKTFSYDVLQVENETLMSSYNVLTTRLSVQEGDAIFTSSVPESDEDQKVRAKTIIDGEVPVYRLDALLKDAEEYLKKFVTEGGDVYNDTDYDETAIRAHFDNRMKGDNRFRTEKDKEKGRQDETARIKKLAAETKDFKKLLETADETLFYRYTRYEQSAENDTTKDKAYEKAYQKEKTEGRENARYGINVAALSGEGKRNVSEYFKLTGNSDSAGVVLLVFDFYKYQPDLQFESISFINTLVREFSDILD